MVLKIKDFARSLLESRARYMALMAAGFVAVILALAFSVKCVTISDGSTVQKVYSLKSQPTMLAEMVPLSSDNYQITDVKQSGNKIDISLKYTLPAYVTVGDNTMVVSVLKGDSVESAIIAAGITLDEHDTVNLPLDAPINETVYIDVVDINYTLDTTIKRIPYQSKTIYSSKQSEKTVKKGSEGEKEVTTLSKFVNGQLVSTEVVKETVLSEAVTEVITIGTKQQSVTTADKIDCVSQLTPSSPIELDKNGNPVNYTKHITVQATAYYDPTGRSASGVKLKPGYVAINTDLYEYGTEFYIKSSDGRYIYGYAVAADTGGFVATRPTNFDLFFPSKEECRRFGRRNIEVYILE